MARILKVLGLVFGAFVVLFAAILIGVAVLVDPNDYKDQITAAVDDATGRTLTLEGDLELHVFPRIGILLGAAELSNAAGFGSEPFARIEGAELRLGLLPLLTRHIEIDSASLTGLRLNLARNASGTTNWDDFARAGERFFPREQTERLAILDQFYILGSFNITGIAIAEEQEGSDG